VILFFLTLVIMSFSFARQTAQAVALVNTPLAAPAESSPPPRRAVASASLAELFGNSTLAAQAAQPTELQLILRASFVDQLAEHSAALIATPGDKARRVAVGEEISPGVRLHAVHQDHVLLLRNGRQESLHFPRAQRPASLVVVPPDSQTQNHATTAFASTGVTPPGLPAADTPRTP
jgi:general secretion pathway protein C